MDPMAIHHTTDHIVTTVLDINAILIMVHIHLGKMGVEHYVDLVLNTLDMEQIIDHIIIAMILLSYVQKNEYIIVFTMNFNLTIMDSVLVPLTDTMFLKMDSTKAKSPIMVIKNHIIHYSLAHIDRIIDYIIIYTGPATDIIPLV